jgi:hypothetical protein
MPFFKDLSAKQRVASSTQYVRPIWTGPSEHESPGVVSVSKLFGLVDDTAIVFDQLDVYTNGLLAHISVRSRRGEAEKPVEPLLSTPSGKVLRFGFSFSNGRAAGERLRHALDLPLDEYGMPEVPVLLLSESSRGPFRRDLHAWVWPLPSRGPTSFFAAWPEYDFPERLITIEEAALTTAARQSLTLFEQSI